MAGRPRHQPDARSRELVEVLSGFGVPQKSIAEVVGITVPTLEKRYRAEIERGSAKVHARLVGNLLRLCQGADGTALKATIFALQCRFGWSQYAPPPAREVVEEPLGKKAALEQEARTGHVNSSWAAVLN